MKGIYVIILILSVFLVLKGPDFPRGTTEIPITTDATPVAVKDLPQQADPAS